MAAGLEEKYELLQRELDNVRAEYRDFTHAVVHDLSAPLRQIEGFSGIILSKHCDDFDDKTKRYFSLMIGGSEKGRAILDALLDYSRLISSSEELEQVDCESLIKEAITVLSSSVESSGARILYRDIPVVPGKKTLLYHLLYHLIHNALHYQRAGAIPKVQITATEIEGHWRFCIEDNGIGFGNAKIERLFTALKRGVREEDYSGMGMGLAIARSVVHRHGGKLWIAAEQDTGSSIYFTVAR